MKKIMIRKGNENQKPYVVYVSGKNKLGSFVCEIVNTGETVFTNYINDLIEFDHKEYKKMLYNWHIENAEKTKTNYLKLLMEII